MDGSISSSTLHSEQTSTTAAQTNHVCKQTVKVVIKFVYRIAHAFPGLGFSLARMSEDPKSQQRLLKLLQEERWAIATQVNPDAGAIIVTCKPEVMSEQMRALLKQLATVLNSAGEAEVAIEKPTTAPVISDSEFQSVTHPQITEQPAKVDYSIVHAIPGRVRFHIPQIASDPKYVQRLETLLKADPAVRSERVNKDAASIAIAYETEMLRDAKKRVQSVFAGIVSHLVSLIQSAAIAAE
ncbi:HMA2 domain-containing protein [Dendronalium sp. ChiSLP03b]|uniref:HMA2 domain-containing protein n=1 Tax=Dendronalium sp. ChiSLP03b TaxID=3075381 RepID=UPI002AD553B3|nr:hypothetical protein [Dendronalium sp. ChiSLP03b]MDZ8205581.1 hypothetical protein [Dendronalium sp. ChiSLP03b]